MAEDEDPEIAAALAKLAEQDAEAADDARAARIDRRRVHLPRQIG